MPFKFNRLTLIPINILRCINKIRGFAFLTEWDRIQQQKKNTYRWTKYRKWLHKKIQLISKKKGCIVNCQMSYKSSSVCYFFLLIVKWARSHINLKLIHNPYKFVNRLVYTIYTFCSQSITSLNEKKKVFLFFYSMMHIHLESVWIQITKEGYRFSIQMHQNSQHPVWHNHFRSIRKDSI